MHKATGGRRWDIEQKYLGSTSVNWMANNSDILFHFNPRPNDHKIVMDTMINHSWTPPEENIWYSAPRPVKATIIASEAGFEIRMDDNSLVYFYKARMNWDLFTTVFYE